MRYLFLFVFLLIHMEIYAQKVINLRDIDDALEKISKMDESYANAGHADTSLALFDIETLIPAWRQILTDLNRHLKEEGLVWEGPLRVWQRMYFAEDGTMEYILYNIRDDTLDEEDQALFHSALESFVQVAQFELQANKKFAQCGQASYMFAKKEE